MSPLKTQLPDNQVIGVAPFGVGGPYLLESTPMQKKVTTGIYAITNPLGQTYIGQSIDVLNRFNDYRYFACKNQPSIYKSLKRFGVDKHVFTLLTECDVDFLDDLEADYKQRFVNENGWEHALFFEIDDTSPDRRHLRIPVKQYTLGGVFLAEWSGMKLAARETGTDPTTLRQCCKGKGKQANGFLWTYADAPAPEPYKREIQKNQRAVKQYSLNGDFICEYPSVAHARHSTGLNAIRDCCASNRPRKTAGGFLWAYRDAPVPKYTPPNKGQKKVGQYTKGGEFIRSFKSATEAAAFVDVPKSNISSAASGKRKTAKGYKWKYINN